MPSGGEVLPLSVGVAVCALFMLGLTAGGGRMLDCFLAGATGRGGADAPIFDVWEQCDGMQGSYA